MSQDADVARVAAAMKALDLRYRSFGNEPVRRQAPRFHVPPGGAPAETAVPVAMQAEGEVPGHACDHAAPAAMEFEGLPDAAPAPLEVGPACEPASTAALPPPAPEAVAPPAPPPPVQAV